MHVRKAEQDMLSRLRVLGRICVCQKLLAVVKQASRFIHDEDTATAIDVHSWIRLNDLSQCGFDVR